MPNTSRTLISPFFEKAKSFSQRVHRWPMRATCASMQAPSQRNITVSPSFLAVRCLMLLLFTDARAGFETDVERSKSITIRLMDAMSKITFRGSASECEALPSRSCGEDMRLCCLLWVDESAGHGRLCQGDTLCGFVRDAEQHPSAVFEFPISVLGSCFRVCRQAV